MTEKETLKKETPFFSMPMRNRRYEIFLCEGDTDSVIPYGVVHIDIEEKGETETFTVRMEIEDWLTHFIKLLGYTEKIDKKSIEYSFDEKGNLTFNGSFGSLLVDEKCNLQYQRSEPTP